MSFAPGSAVGTIEFRCPHCQKLLRISSGAAGRQAQCPECRATMIVPSTAPPPVAVAQAVPTYAPTNGNSQTMDVGRAASPSEYTDGLATRPTAAPPSLEPGFRLSLPESPAATAPALP